MLPPSSIAVARLITGSVVSAPAVTENELGPFDVVAEKAASATPAAPERSAIAATRAPVDTPRRTWAFTQL